MGVSVMRVLPELGLNTQFSGSTPDAVTALLIAPDTRLRAAPYRESGLVLRPFSDIRPVHRIESRGDAWTFQNGTLSGADLSIDPKPPDPDPGRFGRSVVRS